MVVSLGPAGYYLLSSRGVHPILTRRTAATHTVAGPDERHSGVDESSVLSTPGSAEEEHAILSLPAAKARGAKKAAKRPPKRQCQAEIQATVLSHVEDFASSLAALEVSGVAPIPTRCGSCPVMLVEFPPLRARQVAQHYTRLALCLEQAQASRIRNPVKPVRAVPPKGGAHVQHFLRTRHEYPGVIVAAHETRVREDLMTLPGNLGVGNDMQGNTSFIIVVISEFYEESS